jgi:uncharacterized protein YlzI (FlbEa/FlbD family)
MLDREEQVCMIENAQSGCEFDYTLKNGQCFIIVPNSADDVLMRIVAGFILVGCRHIRVFRNLVTVYFDDQVLLQLW